MAKSNSFTCSACGASHSKWSGRCDACGEWNSIVEEAPLSAGPSSKSLGNKRGSKLALTDLATEETPPPRTMAGVDELDRVLGTLYATVEQVFQPLLRVGFASRFASE